MIDRILDGCYSLGMKTDRRGEFDAGWLMCISSLVGGHGVSTQAEELFAQIGSPTAAEVRALNLCEYDRANLNAVRKSAR
jgi:hypothetical protein